MAETTVPVFAVESVPEAGRLTLVGPEGRHAATVRRLRPGELVEVTDGRGTAARCQVRAAGRDHLELDVESHRQETVPTPRLVVVQALAKGERAEIAVELLTEIGVDEIVPWAAERCVARWSGERGDRALARWRTTAREAAKQSRRLRWPVVAGLTGTPHVAERLRAAALAVVLDGQATAPLGAVIVPTAGDVVVVVGPEGGVSEMEMRAFSPAARCRVGPTILRTSTAGAVAAGVLLSRTARWDG